MHLNAKHVAVAVLAVVAAIVGAYSAGLATGRAESDYRHYDRLLSGLGNALFIYDALAIRQPEKAQTVLTANMEADFNAIADIYLRRRFQDFEDLRCAVTQRLRSLRKAGLVIGDDKNLSDKGFDAKLVNYYLDEHCPGDPKKANWAVAKDSEQNS